ncbi:hypothetical protein GRI97_15700 [Altererythrobacter xixiisoli]|uniref:Uncharacterized protein n=1 Tax=Croceibacterium xixiisoli TaxID=1476466 RepID=A0A6I4TW54_9SPHN|nr:hypothetical protein [Croceibacterium xixiisoli]MXP00436.1 hypothetical protein [Croceibacterium xixiisoli]
MRIASQTIATRNPVIPPAKRAYSFTCHCCGTTENSPSPHAPAGWVVAFNDDASFLFCPNERLSAALAVTQ